MEILDDFSQLNHQYDPKASAQLEPLTTSEEVFLWTGRPQALWMDFTPKQFSKEQKTAFLYCLGFVGVVLLFSSQLNVQFLFLLLKLLMLSVLGTLLVLILTESYRRHRTFYGITQQELWVRMPNKRLLKYHIPSLQLLLMYKNSVCYDSQVNGMANRHFIFKNIAEVEQVFALIWQINQEHKS
ncbi:MAG: hypothetical protein AB8E82_10265 [Aureispira sp.]